MTPPDPATGSPVWVMLVDDHELIRHGLARAFERDPGTHVVAQAGSVGQALSSWQEHSPDVVVTDLQLPDGTGSTSSARSGSRAPPSGW